MVNFKIIVLSDNKIFISIDEQASTFFIETQLKSYKFDGVYGKKTNKSTWLELETVPTTITKIENEREFVSYLLKEEFRNPESKQFQSIKNLNLTERLNINFFDDCDLDNEDDFEHPLRRFYETQFKVTNKEIEVEFSINKIATKNSNWEFYSLPKHLEGKITSTLLSEILIHPDLLQDEDCFISSPNLFTLTRNYIKSNIDSRYAIITSNFDFCFTVQKVIKLSVPKEVIIKEKKKNKVSYINDRKVICFEMCPKAYNNYTIIKPIKASSYEQLDKKIDEFLQETINMINEPLIECKHCCGLGVVYDKQER